MSSDTAVAHALGLSTPPKVIVDGILISGAVRLKDIVARMKQRENPD